MYRESFLAAPGPCAGGRPGPASLNPLTNRRFEPSTKRRFLFLERDSQSTACSCFDTEAGSAIHWGFEDSVRNDANATVRSLAALAGAL